MTITYSNGKSTEAVLLSRTENAMRVAVDGAEDIVELANFDGIWVADCEPVSVEFAWQRCDKKPAISEADCRCSHELAARLVTLLLAGDAGPNPIMNAPTEIRRMTACS